MKPRPARFVHIDRRALLISLVFILSLAVAAPALVEYLGPDRVTSVFKQVHVPEKDVWTLTNSSNGEYCLIIHTCDEHPSVERQQALCAWVDGEVITLIGGTRNGETFACPGDSCDVPLLEGENSFTFWAHSSWGDTSQMGSLSAKVDSEGPSIGIPDSWYIWEPLAIAVDDSHGVEQVKLTIHGGSYGNRSYQWNLPNLPNNFIWDRYFGEVVAPIGDYPVTIDATDGLGNVSTEYGTILIPAPETDTEALAALIEREESAPAEGNSEAASSESDTDTGASLPESDAGTAAEEQSSEAASSDSAASNSAAAEPASSTTTDQQPQAAVPPSPGSGSGVLWGAAAAAAITAATAYGLNRKKQREAAIAAKRKEIAERRSERSFADHLQSLRSAAAARMAPIRNAIIAASSAAAAAVEAEAARQEFAQQQADRLEGNLGEREIAPPPAQTETQPSQAPAVSSQPEPVDSWQRIELQRAQNYAGYQPSPSEDPSLLVQVVGTVAAFTTLVKSAFRGEKLYNLIQAAREVDIRQVTTTMRVTGSRSARDTLGFREMVNWYRPENVHVVPQSPAVRAARGLKSWGVAFGIGLGLAVDTSEFLNGNYDRQEYAAALTIDTGITIAVTLVAGAFAGVVTGAAAGALGGSVAVPVVGAVPGAVVGGFVGGLVGIATGILAGAAITQSGARDFLVDRVAQLYKSWTTEP